METETLKLLGEFNGSEIVPADISVSASCHRVPVVDGHTEAIWAGMRDKPTPEEVREAFLRFDPKLGELPSEPERALIVRDEIDRPQPRLDRNMGKGMQRSVGRREGIRYIAMGHNTIRGAAGASVLNENSCIPWANSDWIERITKIEVKALKFQAFALELYSYFTSQHPFVNLRRKAFLQPPLTFS